MLEQDLVLEQDLEQVLEQELVLDLDLEQVLKQELMLEQDLKQVLEEAQGGLTLRACTCVVSNLLMLKLAHLSDSPVSPNLKCSQMGCLLPVLDRE